MNKRAILFFTLLVLILTTNSVYGANPCTAGSVASIEIKDPPNGAKMTMGVPKSTYWDGNQIFLYARASFNPNVNTNCTYGDFRIILEDPFDYYSVKIDYYTSINMNFIKYLNVGTYRWWGYLKPGGQNCPYTSCTTDVWDFTIEGTSFPDPPHIDSYSPLDGTTFAEGTSSVTLTCSGSCPDPAGCNMIFIVDGEQKSTKSFSTCTGINCGSKSYVWTVDRAGWHSWNCKLVEKSSSGRYDELPYPPLDFKINGTTCPTITTNFISPTPQQASTVATNDNYIKFNVKASSSAVVDISLYFCESPTNNCNPTNGQIVSAVYIPLSTSYITKDFLIPQTPSGNYVRWYIRYDYENPSSCSSVYPVSIAGSQVAWYKVNITSPSLNVSLVSPSDNTLFYAGDTIDLIYSVQATAASTTNKVYIDGSPVMTQVQNTGTNSYSISTLPVGNHTWYVEAYDGYSTVQSEIRNLIIQSSAPIIILRGPGNGSGCYYYPSGSTSTSSSPLTWDVAAVTVTHTDRLIINGEVVQEFPPTDNIRTTYNMNIQGGIPYNWQINSTDARGSSAVSSSWCFMVNCSTIWQKQEGIPCGMDNSRIIEYYDINHCAYPTVPVPADNGTYEPCVYCKDEWECSSYEECQVDGTQRCLNVTNVGLIPCLGSKPTEADIRSKDRTCVYSSGVDTIDFSSNELVDLRDPFNKGILPDMFKGIIGLMSTPFLYWLLIIIASLTLFLSAVAVLYWVRNLQ